MRNYLISICVLILSGFSLSAQDVERPLPRGWDKLVTGGRFTDRFKAMPSTCKPSSETWGADAVKPRIICNGLEDDAWSYWGGNIVKGNDGKFHLFVCRWREDSPKGHMQWPSSQVVHAVCDNTIGPFQVVDSIGKGHNPEIQQLSDGRYFIYVNDFAGDAYYLSNSLYGPWEKYAFEYDQRGRPIFDHMANLTFAKREDGSFLMVCRGGGIWISETGLPPYYQVSEKSAYPPFEGKYEDPVVWRTNIQYHMIVNDWLGRIAYYLRSKDGIHWKLDEGEAYAPGIAFHENGIKEDWYKFERIKMFQDEYGRATQANFAVCDTIKKQDKGSDNHSSKNISIPLTVGRLISILDTDTINDDTKTIDVLVKAEDGFNPHKDINLKSLRFGASEEVDYGRGAKVKATRKQGDDLVITFESNGNGLSEANFVAKLLGKTRRGDLLFGFARLPWLNYNQAALSASYPTFSLNSKKLKVDIELQNFGQVKSENSKLLIEVFKDGKWIKLGESVIASIAPYQKSTITLYKSKFANRGEVANTRVTIFQNNQPPVILEGKVVIR